MNSLFLTTLPLHQSSNRLPINKTRKIEGLVEALKGLCEKLSNQNKQNITEVAGRLGLDKSVLAIIQKFSKEYVFDENEQNLIEKLERKLSLMHIIDQEIIKSKKYLSDRHALQPKNNSNHIQTTKTADMSKIKHEIIKQMNYRVLIDKFHNKKEQKKKQALQQNRVMRLKAENKHKLSIVEKQKEKEKQEFQKILMQRKKQKIEDFSEWNKSKSKIQKQRSIFTSLSRYRKLNHAFEDLDRKNHTSQIYQSEKNIVPKFSPSKFVYTTSIQHRNNLKKKNQIDREKESEHINRAMVKLIKITNIDAAKKQKKKKNKNSHFQAVNNEDILLLKENRIKQNLDEKSERRQKLLRERSLRIHQTLSRKEERILHFKRERQEYKEEQRKDHLEKEQLKKQYNKQERKQQKMNNAYHQRLVRARHQQNLERENSETKVINLMHLSDYQLHKAIFSKQQHQKNQ